MPDRIKEAVFDMLGSWFGTPGALPAVDVADVFAGGGTMGLEALSRGAKRCWFAEQGRDALTSLRSNLDQLGVVDEAVIDGGDAWRVAGRLEDRAWRTAVLFLDPPYRDASDLSPSGSIGRFLMSLNGKQSVPEDSIVLFHHEARTQWTADVVNGWRVERVRRYGSAAVSLLVREAGEVTQ
jgi:16S rRNA (guanine(966)-N(2))-methyltransferase RsmD